MIKQQMKPKQAEADKRFDTNETGCEAAQNQAQALSSGLKWIQRHQRLPC